MSFPLYMLWRLSRALLVLVTSPLWVPVLFFIAALGYLILSAHEAASAWYAKVRQDWVRKQ